MKPKLYIPVGIPGCGKSTWAHNVLWTMPTVIYSSDAIRQELHPGPYNPQYNAEVFATYHERITTALWNSLDVVADATNLESRARQTLCEIAGETNAETHVFFFTNTSQAIRRNARRTGDENARVPLEAMQTMISRYEATVVALWAEDYDSITEIGGVYGMAGYEK